MDTPQQTSTRGRAMRGLTRRGRGGWVALYMADAPSAPSPSTEAKPLLTPEQLHAIRLAPAPMTPDKAREILSSPSPPPTPSSSPAVPPPRPTYWIPFLQLAISDYSAWVTFLQRAIPDELANLSQIEQSAIDDNQQRSVEAQARLPRFGERHVEAQERLRSFVVGLAGEKLGEVARQHIIDAREAEFLVIMKRFGNDAEFEENAAAMEDRCKKDYEEMYGSRTSEDERDEKNDEMWDERVRWARQHGYKREYY